MPIQSTSSCPFLCPNSTLSSALDVYVPASCRFSAPSYTFHFIPRTACKDGILLICSHTFNFVLPLPLSITHRFEVFKNIYPCHFFRPFALPNEEVTSFHFPHFQSPTNNINCLKILVSKITQKKNDSNYFRHLNK